MKFIWIRLEIPYLDFNDFQSLRFPSVHYKDKGTLQTFNPHPEFNRIQ